MRDFLLTLAMLLTPLTAFAVTIDTVPVGNAGNFPIASGYGGVPYEYRIGRTEVSNGQYVEFLNAVAKSDPHFLFNVEFLGQNHFAQGIARSGSSPNYVYTVKPNFANKPVTFVNFFDAARFVNWLNNGQPTGPQGPGTTEDGAYSLGDVTSPDNDSVVRNPAAEWFLPSADEWYKAAFHQPATQGGDVDDYWLYATASNIHPNLAIANSVGDIINPGANVANSRDSSGNSTANWNGTTQGNVTTVASAGPLSQSFYGSFDQAGNVMEWTDTIPNDSTSSPDRVAWGFGFADTNPSALGERSFPATFIERVSGFRVARKASPVPLAGDFNNDGVVDAADYVMWRDGLGINFAPGDYWVWRGQFGKTVASSTISAIPEPAAGPLLAVGGLIIIAAWNARRQRRRRSAIRSICLTQAVAAIAGMVQAQPSIAANFSSQVVAVRGTAAPDGNGVFAYFGIPAINDNGQIAFSAGLAATSGGTSDNTGIYRGDGETLSQIARKGHATPGGNGHFLNFVEFVDRGPPINDAGQVAFSAALGGTTGGRSDNGGVFRADGLSLTQIARENQAAPNGNGTFSTFFSPALNNLGQVAFRGDLTGTSGGSSDNSGLFHGAGLALTQVAREGQAVPEGNGSLSPISSGFAFSDAGQIAFRASLTATSGGTGDNMGVYRADGGALTTIAREGQSTPVGSTFRSFGVHSFNNGGEVAFSGTTVTSGTGPNGIFRGSGGALTTIVSDGQVPPDGNGNFSSFGTTTINDVGQVAFRASLMGTSGGTTDDVGVYRSTGPALSFIAREGQAAPDGNGAFSAFSKQALNSAGQMAFFATLAGTSGGDSDDSGVYFYDDAAGLMQVVRAGEPVLGSTIAEISLSTMNSYDDGLNEVGQVAYQFVLADGRSGVAIASPLLDSGFAQGADATIPEPSFLSLLLAALPALLRRRRRR